MNRFVGGSSAESEFPPAPCEPKDLPQLLLAAQEEERQRIAADLHDEIGQCLSAIHFALGSLSQQLAGRMTDAEKALSRDLSQRISLAIDGIRRICMGLCPPMLDDLGIVSAIEWFCGELRKTLTNLDVVETLRADDDAIRPAVKVAIFRILQESCSNACKYSRACRLTVLLETDAEGIRLEVTDDGVGFDPKVVRCACRGYGLASMSKRAAMTGGQVTIRSQSGEGTRILASWPARDPAEARSRQI